MKFYKLYFVILVVFFKTETLFSENNLFNVNNIEVEKKKISSNKVLANKAIKKGFNRLIEKILLSKDRDKLKNLDFLSIKQLVTYYQISNISNQKENKELTNFSVTFDKDKIHNLFYARGISYSEVSDKEFYVLPIIIKENDIYIFNDNYYYKNWNKIYKDDLIEFILISEKIEIIENVNNYRNNLINLELKNLFEEYKNENIALIIIEENKSNNIKVFIKSKIQGENISKSFNFKKDIFNSAKLNEKIIIETKKELINLIKSKNLIDVRTPFFLNTKLDLNKTSNLVELNKRVKKIDAIENIYVQEFNKDHMNLRIKYLGKLDKIINQLKREKIDLKLINDQWTIKVL